MTWFSFYILFSFFLLLLVVVMMIVMVVVSLKATVRLSDCTSYAKSGLTNVAVFYGIMLHLEKKKKYTKL